MPHRAKPAFTNDEIETLLAAFDTVVPSVPIGELLKRAPHLADEVDIDVVEAYAAQKPSELPGVRDDLLGLVPSSIAPEKVDELKTAVGLLRGHAGSLLLTGSVTPFHDQPVAVREKIMLSWKMSRFATLRKIYSTLTKLGNALYMRNSDLAPKAMNYEHPNTTAVDGTHFSFEFVVPAQLEDMALDAIIVGSGSGGGVAAKLMAEAGMTVLVIEKGQHYDLSSQSFLEKDALTKMYDRSALAVSDDLGLACLDGNVFGGGTTVNWAAALQTPHAVREEWATRFNLPYFTSAEFQDDLDYVCETMGVSHVDRHNKQNQLLLEGARRVGYLHAAVPQNNGRGKHGCGHDCANGCRSGGKKGGVQAWLVDAAKAGARFLTGADVRHIEFENRVATGVTVLAEGREFSLKATRIVVAGGSVYSPALLQRSRVANPRVGASIYMHPTNYVYGIFEEPTEPVRGLILTSVVNEYANFQPGGYGVRVETGIMQPIIGTTMLPWEGGAEHKARLAKHNHTVGLIAIARDRHPGKIHLDKRGEPILSYVVAPVDEKSIQVGTVAAAECLRAVNAVEIIVGGRGLQSWKQGDDWGAWTKRVLSTPPGGYGSAHQMGSCRMSSRPADGACDPTGAVYGVHGVWCADASVLPSSSGVNPMVTTMAVATKVVRGIVDGWKDNRAGSAAMPRPKL